ncbi:MAG: hypothetical protein GX442_22695 [Candidatus Riflebacteria bacterium]|nr:hypothetical protein [Candidatus Riflebacteria bacterium]
MAELEKIFLVYQGLETPILGTPALILLAGAGGRQWLEPLYPDGRDQRLGNIRAVIPSFPNDPSALLDACLAFGPHLFGDLPILPAVQQALGGLTQLDFHVGKEQVPEIWQRFRTMALPRFLELRLVEGPLRTVSPIIPPEVFETGREAGMLH